MPACRLLPHPDSSNICSGSSENCSANGSMFFTAGASSFTLLLLFHFALLLGLDCLQLGNLFWLVYIAALNATMAFLPSRKRRFSSLISFWFMVTSQFQMDFAR